MYRQQKQPREKVESEMGTIGRDLQMVQMHKQLEPLPPILTGCFHLSGDRKQLVGAAVQIKRRAIMLKCQQLYTKQTVATCRVTWRVRGTPRHTFTPTHQRGHTCASEQNLLMKLHLMLIKTTKTETLINLYLPTYCLRISDVHAH